MNTYGQNYTPPAGSAYTQGTVPPAAPRPAYAPRGKFPPVAGNGFDAVFMILTLVFSVFAVHSVLFSGFFKLGFTVAYGLWFILENIYIFSKAKPKFSVYSILLGLLSIAASGVFAVYNDEIICIPLLLFIAFANALYFVLGTRQNLFNPAEIGSVLDAARYVIVIPFQFLTEPFRSAFAGKKTAQGQKVKGGAKTGQILLGILISVPIAAILIVLLSNADAAFKGLMSKLFSNMLMSFVKVLLGIILFPLLLSPAFAYRYGIVNRSVKPKAEKDHKKFPSAVAITVLVVISLIFAVYLFAQLAYFFSAFRGILPEGYSASAYARKGFFELCAICALNAMIIIFTMAFVKADSKGSEALLKLFQTFISVVSLVIAASSFSKMYLYIDLYGLTKKRVLTSIFIALLAIVFIALILRTFIKKFPYMKMIAVCTFAVLIAVGYADIDKNITRYNYELYQSGGIQILNEDGGFIDEMGDSAAEYIAKFARDGKGDVQQRAQSWLCDFWGKENVQDYDFVSYSKADTPLAYNKARLQATQLVEEWNKRYHYDTFFTYYVTNADYYYENYNGNDIYGYSISKLPAECSEYCYVYSN